MRHWMRRSVASWPMVSWVSGAFGSSETWAVTASNPILSPITFVQALMGCKPGIESLPVGGGNQAFWYQQEGREDQGVDNRDRDHANGEAAVVVIQNRSQNIAKPRGDEIEAARHH
jgi:hypothetical protein